MKTKTYIYVVSQIDSEAELQFIEGVFSTREKAQAAILEYEAQSKIPYDYVILEKELDAIYGVTT